ncbi:MAG: CMD domain protein [Acidisphaera sp.]|nr:CMD domain protein [Acidisphaera sp.]
MADVIDTLLDLPAGSPLAALRAQRADYVRYTQGSYEVLLAPEDPGGLSLVERAAAALRVAMVHRDERLVAHYRERLAAVGGGGVLPLEETLAEEVPASRLAALLHHADRVARAPGQATADHLATLRAAGFGPRDIVALSQLIAFVSYQARVLAGMRLLAAEVPP